MKRVGGLLRLLLAMLVAASCSAESAPDEPASDPCPTCGDAAVVPTVTPQPDASAPLPTKLSIILDPATVTVRPGSSADVTVTVARPAEVTESLTLEASNLPTNVTALTAPIPGARASFRLMFATNAPQGTFTAVVSVRGTTQTATENLHISIIGSPGAFDTSFGTGGRALSAVDFTVSNIGVQSDDRIVAGGTGGAAAAHDHVAVRFDATGKADATFGTAGKAVADFAGDDIAYDAMLQHDGKFVLAGYQNATGSAPQLFSRFNADGSPDTTFATNGKLALAPSQYNYVYGAREQADGMLVFAGVRYTGLDYNCSVTRLTAQGTPDPTFGAGGYATLDMGSQDYCLGVALDAKGRVVTTGERYNGAGYDLVTARFTAAGAFDSTFGATGSPSSGWVNSVPGGTLQAFGSTVIVQPDGKVLVGGTGPGPSAGLDFVLYRYGDDGLPDATFGTGGKAAFHVGAFDRIYRMALDSQQRIVFVGPSSNDAASQAVVMRLLPTGVPDATFGKNGRVLLDFTPSGSDSAQGLALLSDGKILIGGTSTEAGNNKPWVAKLWP